MPREVETEAPFDRKAWELCAVFKNLFSVRYRTCLKGGFDEPVYLPPTGEAFGEIRFRADFAASALHEVAHWCIAGPSRRELRDFGYWYAPDGRSPQQQERFLKVESKPQALEWIFAEACGIEFHLSFDNLAEGAPDPLLWAEFEKRVSGEKQRWLSLGLPPRARVFSEMLAGV